MQLAYRQGYYATFEGGGKPNRDQADLQIRKAVAGLRDTGVTWQEIGDVLGVSRQAALMHWG